MISYVKFDWPSSSGKEYFSTLIQGIYYIVLQNGQSLDQLKFNSSSPKISLLCFVVIGFRAENL